MPSKGQLLISLGPVGVFALLLASCGGPHSVSGNPQSCDVVVTTNILGDVVQNVIGENASVEVLMREGIDPHQFSPSARQLARVEQADIVIANGLGLEEGLASALGAVEQGGVEVFEVAPELDPLRFDATESSKEDDHGGFDPHFWMDPERVAEGSLLIAEQIAAVCPLDSQAVFAAAESYRDQLLTVSAEVESILDVVPRQQRALVTNHNSLGYLADRYSFEVIGVVIPGGSTLAAPSAGELSSLAEEVARKGLPAVFAEMTESTRLIETLTAEAGSDVDVVSLYTGSLGEAGSGTDTYIGMIETDARRIADALH